MANQLAKSLTVGWDRRKWTAARNGFAAVGGVWTLTEMTTAALTVAKASLESHGVAYLVIMALLFMAVFLWTVREPRHVTFKVPNNDTKITLRYADLFAEKANLLIGVNEFFDGELGAPVEPSTLHGQFIARNYNSSAAAFRAAVDPALAATGVQPVPTARPVEPSKAYQIGTTAKVPNGQFSAFLMAMARTDHATYKAASDVPTLWDALKGGLKAVHDHGGGKPLAMPLFGNGQSGIKLAPQHLLRLLVLALVDFATNSTARLPKRVTVTLHDSCFEELDLREIARDWKKV